MKRRRLLPINTTALAVLLSLVVSTRIGTTVGIVGSVVGKTKMSDPWRDDEDGVKVDLVEDGEAQYPSVPFHTAVIADDPVDKGHYDEVLEQRRQQRLLSQRGDSCQNYNTCIECDATYTCHWCAHDESCHVMGSIYGCTRGVQCFDEDRCKRKEPEPLPLPRKHFTNLDLFPLILVGITTCLAFCCVSFCLCLACGMKGVYDDLFGRIGTSLRHHHHSIRIGDINRNDDDESDDDEEPVAAEENRFLSSNGENCINGGEPAAEPITDEETAPNTDETKQSTPAFLDGARPGNECVLEEQQQQQQQQDEEEEEGTPLLHTNPNNNNNIVEDQRPTAVVVVQESPSKQARRMLRICTCLYFFVVLAIGSLSFIVIRFFPMIPEYSVCNDGVQWGRLFKHLATLNAEVDFEILMSIENANHLGVVVESGEGTFYHGGHFIGNYTIPRPVQAPAMAISDVIIMATLQPKGKTEVMSLLEEYVEDSLVLHIDANARVRVPSLFNFATNVSITDHPIEINHDEDRHLCACKKWDNSSTIMQLGMDLLHSLFDNSGGP